MKGLGFSTDILHSIRFSFDKVRIISFKLSTKINTNELAEKELFSFKRQYKTGESGETEVEEIACKIRGIRQPTVQPPPGMYNEMTECDIRLIHT